MSFFVVQDFFFFRSRPERNGNSARIEREKNAILMN